MKTLYRSITATQHQPEDEQAGNVKAKIQSLNFELLSLIDELAQTPETCESLFGFPQEIAAGFNELTKERRAFIEEFVDSPLITLNPFVESGNFIEWIKEKKELKFDNGYNCNISQIVLNEISMKRIAIMNFDFIFYLHDLCKTSSPGAYLSYGMSKELVQAFASIDSETLRSAYEYTIPLFGVLGYNNKPFWSKVLKRKSLNSRMEGLALKALTKLQVNTKKNG
jgi:hypothetical protein